MPGPYRRQHPKVLATACRKHAGNAAPAHLRPTLSSDAEAIPIACPGGPRLSSTRFFTPSQQGLRLARQPLRQGWRKERYPLHAMTARSKPAVQAGDRTESDLFARNRQDLARVLVSYRTFSQR